MTIGPKKHIFLGKKGKVSFGGKPIYIFLRQTEKNIFEIILEDVEKNNKCDYF